MTLKVGDYYLFTSSRYNLGEDATTEIFEIKQIIKIDEYTVHIRYMYDKSGDNPKGRIEKYSLETLDETDYRKKLTEDEVMTYLI